YSPLLARSSQRAVGVAVGLDVSGAVIVVGSFELTTSTATNVDVGTDTLASGNLLLLSLTDVNLFIGVGGTLSDTTIDTTGATGLLVPQAHLDLAILRPVAPGAAGASVRASAGDGDDGPADVGGGVGRLRQGVAGGG